jgi:aminoglycoside phosphotransferase (APT) family kinase protein
MGLLRRSPVLHDDVVSTERRLSADELRQAEAAWEERVRAAQSAWRTPRAALDATVRRAVGLAPTRLERLHSGQSNETYACTAGAESLIVRAGREGTARFERERWAIEAARGRGVPTPEVLLVTEREIDGELVSFCVERFLPGLPLGRLARRRGRDDPLVARALRHAGEQLAAIHEVTTRGFGSLRADGTAPLSDWPAFLNERMGPIPESAPEEVIRALHVLDDYAGQLEVMPRLLHFDFEPSHLLVNEATGAITGVIDLEDAKSGDPAYEFAQWDAIHDAYAPVAMLALGYADRAGASAAFELRRLLSEVHFRARQIVQRSVPAPMIPAALRRLALALDAVA